MSALPSFWWYKVKFAVEALQIGKVAESGSSSQMAPAA